MQTNHSQEHNPAHLLNLRNMRERTYLSDEHAPYHGVSHPDVVWEKATILIARCERLGIAVDTLSLRDAIELHDALCHLDPKLLGFSSSEQLAATFTQRYLICCGYSHESATKVSDIVMATNPEVRPRTTEEIIIRAADLWNIGSDYQGFLEANRALHQEAMNARRAEIPFESFLRGSFEHLQKFLWPMLELTPEARDNEGRSVWHMNTMRNLSRQWRDTFGEEVPVVAEFFAEGAISPRPAVKPNTLYIAMHPDEESRKAALEITRQAVAGHHGAAFVIPGTKAGFSLPNDTCSTVILHDPHLEAVQEALRVSKPGGSIVISETKKLDSRIRDLAQNLRSLTIAPGEKGTPYTFIMLKEPRL